MPNSIAPADKFEARDLAILRHAADDGVILNATVSKLFFSGREPGHVIRKIADGGDLEVFPRALPGSLSYARLTKSGCIRISVSERLARPLSGHALGQAISIACYSVLGKYRRVRLTAAEMQSLFGDKAPHANIAHVLLSKSELSHLAVMRVVFAQGAIQEIKKQLGKLIESANENPVLLDAMKGKGSYGFLLLCPTETKRAALLEALNKTDLLSRALVLVDVGPGVEELPAYLKALKRG